jgi:hypothetical protein
VAGRRYTPNPGTWLTTTANHKAIDRIRRENKRDDKHKEAQMVYDDDPPEPVGAIDDDRLRLIFTCCHPALAMQTRVALTLRMVGGLTVPEIARAIPRSGRARSSQGHSPHSIQVSRSADSPNQPPASPADAVCAVGCQPGVASPLAPRSRPQWPGPKEGRGSTGAETSGVDRDHNCDTSAD